MEGETPRTLIRGILKSSQTTRNSPKRRQTSLTSTSFESERIENERLLKSASRSSQRLISSGEVSSSVKQSPQGLSTRKAAGSVKRRSSMAQSDKDLSSVKRPAQGLLNSQAKRRRSMTSTPSETITPRTNIRAYLGAADTKTPSKATGPAIGNHQVEKLADTETTSRKSLRRTSLSTSFQTPSITPREAMKLYLRAAETVPRSRRKSTPKRLRNEKNSPNEITEVDSEFAAPDNQSGAKRGPLQLVKSGHERTEDGVEVRSKLGEFSNERTQAVDERVGDVSERAEFPEERGEDVSERADPPEERGEDVSERAESPEERVGDVSERAEPPKERGEDVSERTEDASERAEFQDERAASENECAASEDERAQSQDESAESQVDPAESQDESAESQVDPAESQDESAQSQGERAEPQNKLAESDGELAETDEKHAVSDEEDSDYSEEYGIELYATSQHDQDKYESSQEATDNSSQNKFKVADESQGVCTCSEDKTSSLEASPTSILAGDISRLRSGRNRRALEWGKLRTPVLPDTTAVKATPVVLGRPVLPAQQKKPAAREIRKASQKENKPKKKASADLRLPSSLVSGIFRHFSALRVSKDALDAVHAGSDAFFEHITNDLSSYCKHAGRKTLEESDVELLMRRQGLVKSKESFHALIEKYLPMEYKQEIIPTARSGNKVVPKEKK